MSRLEELIQELCPNGVEKKKIKDIVISIHSGLNPRKNFVLNTGGNLFYVTVKEITTGKIVFSEKTDKIDELAWEKIQNRSHLEKGDILLSGIGTIGKVAVVDIDVNNWNCSESVLLLKPNQEIITSKYLKYILESTDVQNHFNGTAVGSTLKGIRIKDLEELEVLVPPMEVQCEIVHLLDQFTLLTAELTAELIARKQQYEYYSNYLFDLAKKNKTIYIKDCCSVIKGKSPIQKTEPGEFPMVVTTSERKTSKEYQFDSKSVCIPLISSRGHGVASLNHVYYQEGKFALGNILCAVTPNNYNEVCSKYLYYYFELTKDYTLVPLMKGGANVAMHLTDVQNVKIPLPPLEEQQRIVDILDKFDAYCNDLTQGLPAEIELRKQQYEYYRDKLLSFKELK